MKFAIIIPTRKDRPAFIEQCKFLIKRQSLQPNEVIWVDYEPTSNNKDITQRYRMGVELATKNGHDFVVFWEDDDWYDKDYLLWLTTEWRNNNLPNFFGVGETYYYHIMLGKSHHMKHVNRTSAFCTLAKLPWKCSWPIDSYPFLDMHIHKSTQVKTINFPKNKIYAIGIKHGIGLSGGGGHSTTFRFYQTESREWFYKQIGEDRHFYDSVEQNFNKIIPTITPNPNINHNNIPRVNGQSNIQKRKITPNNTNSQLSKGGPKIRRIRKD